MVLKSEQTVPVCFLILAHQDTNNLARLVDRLLDSGNAVAVHFDARGGEAPKEELKGKLGAKFDSIVWVDRRETVHWGMWSMVQATINALVAIDEKEVGAEYVYLLSGADYPIRPIDELVDYLQRNRGTEFIESVDADRETWVAAGIQRERYEYAHPLSWRDHSRLFGYSLFVQKRLKMKRRFPRGYKPYIGSQWWVLSWDTCKSILARAKDKALINFFRRVCVPDEMFFQTVVREVVDDSRLSSRHLTLYQFTPYGVPVVFSNGDESYLSRQPFFFARKVSTRGGKLRDSLDRIASNESPVTHFSDEDFGTISQEYDIHCLTYRNGLFGRRVMGRIDNPGLGDLEWNRRPYFVVVGDSLDHLHIVQEMLNAFADARCHGELFHGCHIEFFENKQRYGGYDKTDVAIRDNDPKNFLVDLFSSEPDALMGYLARWRAIPGAKQSLSAEGIEHLLTAHAWDPNAAIIVLSSDPQRTFANRVIPGATEESMMEGSAEKGQLPAIEACAGIYEFQMTRLAGLADAARASGARLLLLPVCRLDEYAERSEAIAQRLHDFLLGKQSVADGIRGKISQNHIDETDRAYGDLLNSVENRLLGRFGHIAKI